MSDGTTRTNGWRRFWNKGNWWRAIILAAAYYIVYQLFSLALIPVAGSIPEGSAASVLVFTGLPIFLGCIVLVVFAASVGWLREIFGPQPIRGRGWMWIAVVVVLGFNILHVLTTDLGKAGIVYVLTWLLVGLFIGFAEEVLTRGFVVDMMRKAGHREISVAAVSAAIFAGLHSGNLLTGQPLIPTLIQIVYTFGFGICMYLALRVTGTIIAPILLHASTDPTIFLQATFPVGGPLSAFAGFGNVAVIITGLVLLIFVRGRVAPRDAADPAVQTAG